MASPPFNPNETSPGDTDVVSLYPALARQFRDIMESWMIFEHGRSGHHTFPVYTTSERDAVTTWEVGSLVYNETLKQLQVCIDDSPMTFEAPISFPVGTEMLFRGPTAPTGWTKVADAAYENAAIRLTTGTPGVGGTAGFTVVFDARTILQANLPNINLTAASDGAHTHTIPSENDTTAGAAGSNSTGLVGAGQNTGSSGAHTHNVPLGGSGTAMDFDVKHVDYISCVKA